MVTFRQLEICLGSLWRRNLWNIKEGTPKSWATIAEGYSSSRSKAAQIRSPVLEICAQGTCQHLLCKERHWTINEEKSSSLTWESSPSSHAQGWEEDQRR
ncbi:unnamed protein product [Microthlaspi erraticum]|uniref:Uncharacterized protein n=1 Tax=Microthlaspi erraticum TaxID=1685480 RepID=A0A6D2LP46_9BRAS|nr:unnamed protein product [Microthlaspi erraticum]